MVFQVILIPTPSWSLKELPSDTQYKKLVEILEVKFKTSEEAAL